MKNFITDVENLLKNHWKVIFLIILVIFLVSNYPGVKAGLSDGWSRK
jgi:hypothetical protein